jgi:hypothetical protein
MEGLYTLFKYFELFMEAIHPQLKNGFYDDLDLNTNINDIENKNN